MPDPITADEATGIIERDLAENAAEVARLRSPDDDVGRIGRAAVIRNPGGHPGSAVYGFSHADLDRLPDIFDFLDGETPPFYLSPAGFSRALANELSAHGYGQTAFDQVLLFGEPAADIPSTPAGITVDPLKPDDIDDYVETMARGFEWHESWRESAKDTERLKLENDGNHGFFARVDGEPAGTGNLIVRDGVGRLDNGAVAPPFRRRGCQTALLHARLHAAHRLGCSIVVSGGAFGSTSLRNQERVGLRIAYIETTWEKKKETER